MPRRRARAGWHHWRRKKLPERFSTRPVESHERVARGFLFVYALHLGRRRINHTGDLGDTSGGKSALLGVFPDRCLVLGDVDTIDFVAGDVAFDPLDFGPHAAQDGARLLGNSAQLFGAQRTCIGNLPLNQKFRHRSSSSWFTSLWSLAGSRRLSGHEEKESA